MPHADARAFKLSELLKDAFPDNVYEVGGMIESAETCEFVLNGAFLKDKEIEAEQVRGAPPVVISSDDMRL